MKYSPKVNDQLVRSPKLADLHPLQDPSTVQGILEILWRLERMLCEISGMDRVTPPARGRLGGDLRERLDDSGLPRRARRRRAARRGRHDDLQPSLERRGGEGGRLPGDHPAPRPGDRGRPTLDALRAAVGERTAALLITNPEDTGIFNPDIDAFVRVVHDVGGLAAYDQANANGILGITRARDAGFDLCHFNLHKTFSTPHGSGGPGAGACGVSADLAPFLPRPDRRAGRRLTSSSTTTGRRASGRSVRGTARPPTSSGRTPGS